MLKKFEVTIDNLPNRTKLNLLYMFLNHQWLYMSSIYYIVNDLPKLLKSSSDRTLHRQGKLNRFLCNLENKDFFTEEQYDIIYSCGSQTVRLYSTPKMLKLKSPTFNPTVSSIDTYNYKFVK